MKSRNKKTIGRLTLERSRFRHYFTANMPVVPGAFRKAYGSKAMRLCKRVFKMMRPRKGAFV